MKEYEINEDTLALVSLDDKTRVFEKNNNFIVEKEVSQIMEDSCQYFGSSLSGRKKGTEKLFKAVGSFERSLMDESISSNWKKELDEYIEENKN